MRQECWKMKFEKFINLLGQTSKNKDIVKLLAQLRVSQPVELAEGETDLYIVLQDLGFCLLFEDEAIYKSSGQIGDGNIFLVSIFFYGKNNVEGYEEYKNELPADLKFSDSRSTVHQKLGPPAWQNEFLNMQRWHYSTHQIHLTFDDDWNGINTLTLGKLYKSVSSSGV